MQNISLATTTIFITFLMNVSFFAHSCMTFLMYPIKYVIYNPFVFYIAGTHIHTQTYILFSYYKKTIIYLEFCILCIILQLALVGICLGIGFSLFEVTGCLNIRLGGLLFSIAYFCQGFTFPVRSYFLEDVLEMTGYKLTSFNQIDDYGQEKMWKTQKQLAPRKRKNQITSLVEVCVHMYITFLTIVGLL